MRLTGTIVVLTRLEFPEYSSPQEVRCSLWRTFTKSETRWKKSQNHRKYRHWNLTLNQLERKCVTLQSHATPFGNFRFIVVTGKIPTLTRIFCGLLSSVCEHVSTAFCWTRWRQRELFWKLGEIFTFWPPKGLNLDQKGIHPFKMTSYLPWQVFIV